VLLDAEFKDYIIGFPAKRITIGLEWDELVADYRVVTELEEINTWIVSHGTIIEGWGLSCYLKADYHRALSYGPPGTDKTLAATLSGKKNGMDVYV